MLRFIDFADRRATVARVHDLAKAAFREDAWQALLHTYGWSIRPHNFYRRQNAFEILFPETQQLLIQDESAPEGAGGAPSAAVTFDAPEFSLLQAYLWCEQFTQARARSKFADAFAELQREATELIGEPNYRLHFTQNFLPPAIFCACVWCTDENDLYLLQDVGDMHGGTMGIIGLRILPKQQQPAPLPPRSVFHP